MAQNLMSVHDVAAALHVSAREVVRMAEQKVLPAIRTDNTWRFRPGEVWNWIEANLHSLPHRRARDRHPPAADPGILLASVLRPEGIELQLRAKTKPSVIRELARLAEHVDQTIDVPALVDALTAREDQSSTALGRGVAVPHPARPFYCQGPVVVAARAVQSVVFGDRGGALTDLFFMICCPNQVEHLLYLGRLGRLLVDSGLHEQLRVADSVDDFLGALLAAEAQLCRST